MKKLLVITICILSFLLLVSCGGSMTEESLKAELERLLPLSYELNEIFWGEGLPVIETESKDRLVTVDSSCGYNSIDDIKAKASEVFYSEYLDEIYDAMFFDSDDITPRYVDLNGKLKRDVTVKGFGVKGNIVIDSAKILRQNRGMVLVSCDYADGGQTEITLVLDNGKWYLNSPTY